MSTEQHELNVLIEKIRANDTSLDSELNCYGLLHEQGMTLWFVLDDDWSHVGLSAAVR